MLDHIHSTYHLVLLLLLLSLFETGSHYVSMLPSNSEICLSLRVPPSQSVYFLEFMVMRACVCHMSAVPTETRKELESRWLGAACRGCWKKNSGSFTSSKVLKDWAVCLASCLTVAAVSDMLSLSLLWRLGGSILQAARLEWGVSVDRVGGTQRSASEC